MTQIRTPLERLESAQAHMVAAREDLADIPGVMDTVLKLEVLIDDLTERIVMLGG